MKQPFVSVFFKVHKQYNKLCFHSKHAFIIDFWPENRAKIVEHLVCDAGKSKQKSSDSVEHFLRAFKIF